ncbi:MAG TPA: glycosyltransferase family 39 protein [Pyrinomonadaceae bacterium]|nr:glycosyltransferase family 39 protein [Pyrinomonadaceae bacterium]
MRKQTELENNPERSAGSEDLPYSFRRAWCWWVIPAALALVLALIFADPFIGDWDALDYTLISIKGRPSSMALGRSLFILTNHAAWRAAQALFGLSIENAYLLFKYMVVLQAPLAVLACWALARDLTRSLRTATVAALLVATSPFFVIYSGQVMTEIPSLLLVALALLVYLRGVRNNRFGLMLLGAAILGAAVNVREPAAFYAPWLIAAPLSCGWSWSRRELSRVVLCVVVFLVVALGPFAYWFWSDFEGYRTAWHGWRESMRLEAARHPFSARNLLAFVVYFFLAAPLVTTALPVAAFKEWRAKRFSPLLAAAAVGFCATLLLLFNYSTTINWRYFLTGLPALAPLVAAYFMRSQAIKQGNDSRAFRSVVACVALVAIVLGLYLKPSRDKFTAQHAEMKEYRGRLAVVPPGAVMISGAQSIAVTYWREIDGGRWEVVGAGSGWPGAQLSSLIEKHLAENRPVVIDADPRLWPPCGWQETETRELVRIEPGFHFRRIQGTLYEVRPLADESATDAPDLKSLLPERRTAEVEKCRGQGKLS